MNISIDEKARFNKNFLSSRVEELKQYIEKQVEENESILPITVSNLELNKNLLEKITNNDGRNH